MDKNTNSSTFEPVYIDDLSILVRLNNASSPNDAETLRESLDMVEDIDAWLTDLDTEAECELEVINDYRRSENLMTFTNIVIRVSHADGRSWEGEAWVPEYDPRTRSIIAEEARV